LVLVSVAAVPKFALNLENAVHAIMLPEAYMSRKAKFETLTHAVNTRKMAYEYFEDKKNQLAVAKKQYDQAATEEAAAAKRCEKADQELEKALADLK
jgi:uncharacterized protein YPO0396